MVDCAERASGLAPTIDVALTAMAECCCLPEDAVFALFAIGRSVGWMAHSIEQMVSGTLLRPRARYVGPATVSAAAPETSLSRPPRPGASSTGS